MFTFSHSGPAAEVRTKVAQAAKTAAKDATEPLAKPLIIGARDLVLAQIHDAKADDQVSVSVTFSVATSVQAAPKAEDQRSPKAKAAEK